MSVTTTIDMKNEEIQVFYGIPLIHPVQFELCSETGLFLHCDGISDL